MNTEQMVEIPADKLREAVKLAYDYSRPQRLGFLHARDGGLDEETLDWLLADRSGDCVVSMDYVHGRACKFGVWRKDERLFVRPRWYDHSDHQLEQLLTGLGVEDAKGKMAAASGEMGK